MRVTVYKLRWTKILTGKSGIVQEFNGAGFNDVVYASRKAAFEAAENYARNSLFTEKYEVIPTEDIKSK